MTDKTGSSNRSAHSHSHRLIQPNKSEVSNKNYCNSKLFVLPVIWLPSWISSVHRRPTKSEVPLLEVWPREHNRCRRWNFVAVCCRTLDVPGAISPPPRHCRQTSQKPLPGERLKLRTSNMTCVFPATIRKGPLKFFENGHGHSHVNP